MGKLNLSLKLKEESSDVHATHCHTISHLWVHLQYQISRPGEKITSKILRQANFIFLFFVLICQKSTYSAMHFFLYQFTVSTVIAQTDL